MLQILSILKNVFFNTAALPYWEAMGIGLLVFLVALCLFKSKFAVINDLAHRRYRLR